MAMRGFVRALFNARFVYLAIALCHLPSTAIALTDAECTTLMQDAGIKTSGAPGCQQLGTRAAALIDSDSVADEFAGDVAERSLESTEFTAPRLKAGPGSQGTLSQAVPLPGVFPTGLVGAELATAQTSSGSHVLATVSLNPLSLFAAGYRESRDDQRRLASLMRFVDLSATIPVFSDSNGSSGGIEYVGARMRMNWLGFSNGGVAYDSMRELLESSAKAGLGLSNALAEISRMVTAFLRAPETTGEQASRCATAVAKKSRDIAIEQCGVAAATVRRLAAAIRRAEDTAETVLAEADGNFVGLDLRYDHGDPHLTGDRAQRGERLLFGLAGGFNFGLDRCSDDDEFETGRGECARHRLGLGLRVGGHYVALHNSDTEKLSIDYAAAAAYTYVSGAGEVVFSFGIEGRHNVDDNKEVAGIEYDVNSFDLRAGLRVPVMSGTGFDLGITVPRNSGESVVVTVGGDWGLLTL